MRERKIWGGYRVYGGVKMDLNLGGLTWDTLVAPKCDISQHVRPDSTVPNKRLSGMDPGVGHPMEIIKHHMSE